MMMLSLSQNLIYACIDDNIKEAKEIYSKNPININEIKHDTETCDIQGPYSLFECMCIKNHLEIVKWFIELGVDHSNYINGFISACQYNHLELVEYLFDNKKDIKLDFQTAFIVCCYLGNFEIVKWLHINTPEPIDIHINNETPFLYAIVENHFETAKWLYYISITEGKLIDIHADNNYAFIYACYNGRLDICKWLYLISNNTINKRMNDDAPLKSARLSGNQELIDWLQN
jgi:ankyrin repeat protein